MQLSGTIISRSDVSPTKPCTSASSGIFDGRLIFASEPMLENTPRSTSSTLSGTVSSVIPVAPKKPAPRCLTPSGNWMPVSPVSANASLPMLVTPVGSTMLPLMAAPLNAPAPMVFSEEGRPCVAVRLALSSTLDSLNSPRLWHEANALLPISVTLSDMVTSYTCALLISALSGMTVAPPKSTTCTVEVENTPVPSFVTDCGSFTVSSFSV